MVQTKFDFLEYFTQLVFLLAPFISRLKTKLAWNL